MARAGFDLVGIGALNVDLIATGAKELSEDGEFFAPRDEILRRFETEGLDYESFLGGSAFNAVAMVADLQRPMLRVGFLGVSGEVPEDLDEAHAARLTRLGVEFMGTEPEGIRAGTCGSFSDGRARNLWVDPGANLKIAEALSDRVLEKLDGTRVLHVSSLFDPPGSNAVTDRLAEFMEEFRSRNPESYLLVDPGDPWTSHIPPGVAKLYAIADVVLLNEPEFRRLAKGSPESVNAVRQLRDICPQAMVHVLKNTDGVRVVHPTGVTVAAVRRADASGAVDLTGAGDAVAAGFIGALCERRTVLEGITLGLELARRRVSEIGDRGHSDLARKIPNPWDLGPVRLGRSPRALVKAFAAAAPAVQAAAGAIGAIIAAISALIALIVGR